MASGLDQGAPEARPSLDPRILRVVRSSAARLSQHEDAFVRQLYSDIRALVPGTAASGRAVAERIVQSLLWAAATDQPPDVVARALRWVGGKNWLDGLREASYVDVAHALVRAVRTLSWEAESTSIGSAWVSYFLWAEPHLVAGSRHAAAEQAAAEQAAAEQAAARREAARQEAARAQALARDPRRSRPQATGDVNLEMVANLLDDEDEDDDAGYGQIMVSMTRNQRRDHPQPPR